MATQQAALTAKKDQPVTLHTAAGKLQGILTDDGTAGDSVVLEINDVSVTILKSLIVGIS